MSSIAPLLNVRIKELELALDAYLPETHGLDEKVWQSARYSLMAGGKRVRPVLLLEFAGIFGLDRVSAMPFACALEFIHTYSLIHDDLPCMDNDTLRRGRATNHVVYGESIALLAGDALLNRAYEIMLGAASDENQFKAARYIAQAAGISGMIGGQAIDLSFEGRQATVDELNEMHTKKTGALISAACVGGAMLAGAQPDQIHAAADYATALGYAFQITDDILDVTGDEKTLGKNVGSDAKDAKCTFVSVFGLDGARQAAARLTDSALESLTRLPSSAFLEDFTKALLGRDH